MISSSLSEGTTTKKIHIVYMKILSKFFFLFFFFDKISSKIRWCWPSSSSQWSNWKTKEYVIRKPSNDFFNTTEYLHQEENRYAKWQNLHREHNKRIFDILEWSELQLKNIFMNSCKKPMKLITHIQYHAFIKH